MSTIPKRLIQTGKSRDLPLFARAIVANLRLLNPDYEHLYFDDADVEAFIDTNYPEYRPVFDGFPVRIQRYDFFRYLAVYHYGGFYFDLDVLLAKNLDDLLPHACIFPFEELSLHQFLRETYNMDWEIGNYAFGARAGHPFIGAIIDNCVKAQRDPSWAQLMWESIPSLFRRDFYVLDTTGPGMVSRTLAEYCGAGQDVKVLFPEDVCDSATWHQFGNYGLHLEEGTWRNRKNVWRRKLESLWETRTRSRALPASRLRGPSRALVSGRPALIETR